MSSIRVSEKHGVNPSLDTCFWCGGDAGIVLFGRLKDDAEAPRRVCSGYAPCSKCQEMRAMGITIIALEPKAYNGDKPEITPGFVPTGRWSVLKEEAVIRILNQPLLDQVLKTRAVYMLEEEYRKLIPDEEINNVDKPSVV